jgi:alkylated DNA repair dioxygenase AlkB
MSDHNTHGLQVYQSFISKETECEILSFINERQWKKSLRTGVKTQSYTYKDCQCNVPNAVIKAIQGQSHSCYVPECIDYISKQLISKGLTYRRPDFVDVVRYQRGQGTKPFNDSHIFTEPIVSIFLLSDHTMNFTFVNDDQKSIEVNMNQRDLLIITDDYRWSWNREIPTIMKDQVLINIVFRYF